MAAATQQEAAQSDADEQFLSLKQTHVYSGHGPSWTWDSVRRGDFPAPIHIGKSARWLRSEVLAWQKSKIQRSRGAA